MPIHRMHLKGPWNTEPAAESADSAPAVERVKLPATWEELFGTYRGKVRFRRRFHQPTNLDPHEHVFLVFDGVGGAGTVTVNETLLGKFEEGVPPPRFDITHLLQVNNEVVVELEYHSDAATTSPGGLWGPVALEIDFESPRN